MTRHAAGVPPAARMRDVADAAGVSLKTVSRVVNQEPGVRPETVERVRATIAELGFHRNDVARSLASGRSRSIGLLIPNISNPVYAAVLNGAEEVAEQRGYMVIVGNTAREPGRQLRYLQMFHDRRADGVLLFGFAQDPGDVLPRRTAAVHLQPSSPSFISRWPMFGFANRESAAKVVDHLLELGHRHVLFLAGMAGRRVTEERLQGYRHSLRRARVPVDDHLMKVGLGYGEEDGYRETISAFRSARLPRPTAVVACNDLVALGAMAALSELALTVPDDISVVGMDDIPLAAYTVPRLTTVRRDAQELGMRSARALVDLIEGEAVPSEEVLIPCSLVIRESTARAAGAQARIRSSRIKVASANLG